MTATAATGSYAQVEQAALLIDAMFWPRSSVCLPMKAGGLSKLFIAQRTPRVLETCREIHGQQVLLHVSAKPSGPKVVESL